MACSKLPLVLAFILGTACSSSPPEDSSTARFELAPGVPCRTDAPAPGTFTRLEASSGLAFTHDAFPPPDPDQDYAVEDLSGVSMADLDDDGWLDLVFANGAGDLYLFWNRGESGFEASTITLDDPTRVVVAADIDHDRIRDLLVVTRVEPVWLKGRGDGTFEPPQELLHPDSPDVSTFSIALGDLNSDNLVDLFFGNQQTFDEQAGTDAPGPELFLIAAYGQFVDASALIPPGELEDLTFLAVLSDLDGDGDLDVYEINDARDFGKETGADHGGNRLLRNDGRTEDGGVVFTDVTANSGADINVSGMGGGAADVDNDGRMDLFVTVMLPDANALLKNVGEMKFTDVTETSGANTMAPEHDVAWGSIFFDADMDGWLDLYVCHGFLETGADPTQRNNLPNQPNSLLRNRGDGTFEDVSAAAGVDSDRSSRSPAVGDLNRDGFPDLVVGNVNDTADVYLNGCDDRPWLTVILDGGDGNRDAVGATLTARAGDLTQVREIQLGSNSLYGTSAPEAYFGFPAGTDQVDLDVRWPGGATESFTALPVRHRVSIRR